MLISINEPSVYQIFICTKPRSSRSDYYSMVCMGLKFRPANLNRGMKHFLLQDRTTLRAAVNATKENSDDIARVPELTEKEENDKVDAGEVDDNEEEEEEEEKEEKKEEKEENDEKKEAEEEDEEEEEEEAEEGEVEEEYEGQDDDEDEYEDELKAIAESHEAMSKDEARNSNASSVGGERVEGKLSSVKNFDSHEKSNEEMSDEDVASNETIGRDVIEEEAQDEEVRSIFTCSHLKLRARGRTHNLSRLRISALCYPLLRVWTDISTGV